MTDALTESEYASRPWTWRTHRWWADFTWTSSGNVYRWFFRSPEDRKRFAQIFALFATVMAEGHKEAS